jgi:hypothetical protein
MLYIPPPPVKLAPANLTSTSISITQANFSGGAGNLTGTAEAWTRKGRYPPLV